MSANRQWKVVDERYSGNVFTDDHWYSTHIPRIVRVRTTQTTQKIRKTAQYCANFYAKPGFELLKTWNRVKHRYGEHRRTTAEVRNLCVIHAFNANFGQCDWAFSCCWFQLDSLGDRVKIQPKKSHAEFLFRKCHWIWVVKWTFIPHSNNFRYRKIISIYRYR